MVESQTRWLLGLAVGLVVVMAALFAQGPEVAAEDPDATVPIWALEAEHIERIDVRRAAGPLVLRREGSGWWLVEPTSAPADFDRTSGLVSALAQVERGVLIEGALEPEEYGLGERPEAEVVVTLGSGLERRLAFGTATSVGYRTYARVADGPIVAVQGDLHSILTEEATAFRDHRVFRFDPREVRTVAIQSPQGTLTMRGKGTSWQLDGFGRADPDRVDDVVMGLLDLRFEAYLDTQQAVAGGPYQVTVGEEDGDLHVLSIGDETPMGMVASTHDGRFGTLFPELVRQLQRGPTDVADPRAFVLDLQRADAVTVQLGDRVFEAHRNGSAWTSEQLPADATWRAVTALSEVAATYRRDEPTGAYEGAGKVIVHYANDLRVVWLGEHNDDHWVARDGEGGSPYRVVAADLDAFIDMVW